MNLDLAASVLVQGGTAVFQQAENGELRASFPPPAWLAQLLPDGPDGAVSLEVSPFLENFLIDAEHFWSRRATDAVSETARIKSGPWIEVDRDGTEYPLEASALVVDGQRVLLVERIQASFAERVNLLQQAREQHLALGQLGKEMRAMTERGQDLQRAISGLERTLAHAPASLMTIDPSGVIRVASGDDLERLDPLERGLIGRSMLEVFSDHAIVRDHVQQALVGATIEADETIFDRSYEVRYTPIFDASGAFNGAMRFAYDVTEREAAEALMLTAKDEAERAVAAKTEFVAHMSHELRTPLTSVIGFAEVLYYGMAGPVSDVQRQYLSHIQHSGEHLLSLINDILDLSRIESGTLEMQFQPVSVAELVESSLRLIRNRAERASIKLSARINASLRVRGDERKLRQAMLNLLSNAVKFTPERGRVTVKAVAERDAIEISVTDTGIGISTEDQRRLFRPFSRVGSQSDEHEGTGLGLVITRRMIELHGGSISLKSEIGKGSTFTVRLPRARR